MLPDASRVNEAARLVQSVCENMRLSCCHQGEDCNINIARHMAASSREYVIVPTLHRMFPSHEKSWKVTESNLVVTFSRPGNTIRYDNVYLTCSKKLMGSQLSLPHGINKKLKCETKN